MPGSPAIKIPPRLRAKAIELGLPVCDYDESLSMAIRHMDGGRQSFLRFVSLAAQDGEDDACRFQAAYLELKPIEQQRVSFDLLCLVAGVSPVQLLKTVVGVAFESSVDTARLVAAAAHPAVVAVAVKSAKRLNSDIGQRDRHALLSHAGFLPTPRGSQVHVNVRAEATAAAAAKADAGSGVPSFLEDAASTELPRAHVQRQLTAGPMVVDADPILESEVEYADV